MLLVRTYIAASPIEGLGVFADEYIPSGTRIWQYNSCFDVALSPDEIEKLPQHMKDFVSVYSFPHADKENYLVLESDNGRFMNHNLTPNTIFKEFHAAYSIRDICRGEEITCNYFEFDPTFTGQFSESTPFTQRPASAPAVTSLIRNGRA